MTIALFIRKRISEIESFSTSLAARTSSDTKFVVLLMSVSFIAADVGAWMDLFMSNEDAATFQMDQKSFAQISRRKREAGKSRPSAP